MSTKWRVSGGALPLGERNFGGVVSAEAAAADQGISNEPEFPAASRLRRRRAM